MITRAPPSLSLTEESFPCSLPKAVSLIQTFPASRENDELTLALAECFDLVEDGTQFSAEVDIQRWGFRYIQGEWIVTDILHQLAPAPEVLSLLVRSFSAAARAAWVANRTLYLENSKETATIFYGFELPLNGAGVVVAYVPPEILCVCSHEAINLGYNLVAHV